MSSTQPGALPTDLELRELRRGDEQAIAKLIGACDQTYSSWAHGWTPPPEKEERKKWANRLAADNLWTLGVFDADTQLIAMVTAEQATGGADAPPLPRRGNLRSLFVHPSRWREGIGAILLGKAERAMRELGYTSAELETPEQAPVRHLYERAGWMSLGPKSRHQRLGLTMVNYEKGLG